MKDNQIEIVTGETKPWEIQVIDDDGGFVDLSGGTVTLTMRLRNSQTNKFTDASTTLTNPTNGVFMFLPSTTHFDTEGTYDLQLNIADTYSRVTKNFDFVEVVIRRSL